MAYRTIHTRHGLERLAAAEATNAPIVLTHMAVGDGNGNATNPAEAQTQLVRELFRATVNRVTQSPTNSLEFTCELLIPAAVGGFVVRECGIFDADGSLFAVANIPDTYKPVAGEGAFADMAVRMQFQVANASIVALQIDPNVAIASHTWIINTITPAYLLPGGNTHQVLTKRSNADGDTEWTDPSVAEAVVTTIEEKQTLAADQTEVMLATVTTRGLAVYVDGHRIGNEVGEDGWLADADEPATKLILGKSYPADSVIRMVQNDPLGRVPYPLARDQNLADVPDKALARANLGVFSREEARQLAPVGEVAHFARTTAPTGWLKANGAAVSRVAYADLFAVIGETFGSGDGFSSFNLPDLRGEFVRGLDDGRGIDYGRGMGTWQDSQNRSHTHAVNDAGHAHGLNDPGHGHGVTDPGHAHGINDPGHQHGFSGGLRGGSHSNSDNGGGVDEYLNGTTGSERTNVSVQGANTNVSVQSNGTGMSVRSAGTGISLNSSGGSETRGRNVALLACIKF